MESLGTPFSCFDAGNYGALLLVDSEEEYFTVSSPHLTKSRYYVNLSFLVSRYEYYLISYLVSIRVTVTVAHAAT